MPPRRARRRRRQSTPWLQRNALSVVAVSILVAVLGLGFGLVQMINRADSTPALVAVAPAEPSATASAGPGGTAAASEVQIAAISGGTPLGPPAPTGTSPRQIQTSARVLQPNYTVAAGDTLGQIAVRFNTTVDRIQALNNLPDPRALRIGTKLVIPPAL